jgi:hypothetical protein
MCPVLDPLWAHPFSSLALVMAATVRNPLPGQPSNRLSVLDLRDLVLVVIQVIISLWVSVNQLGRSLFCLWWAR